MVASFGAINLQNGGWKCLQMRRSVKQNHTFIHFSLIILFHTPLFPVFFSNQQATNTNLYKKNNQFKNHAAPLGQQTGLRTTSQAGCVKVLKGGFWTHRSETPPPPLEPWSLSLVLNDPSAFTLLPRPRTFAVSRALIVLNKIEPGETFNNSLKRKGKKVLFSWRGWGKDALSVLPLPLSDARVCVCQRRQHPSRLSLSFSLCVLAACVSQPPSSPLLPGGEAELISSDVLVTEAECDSWSPGVAAQQGHQFPWLVDCYECVLLC